MFITYIHTYTHTYTHTYEHLITRTIVKRKALFSYFLKIKRFELQSLQICNHIAFTATEF